MVQEFQRLDWGENIGKIAYGGAFCLGGVGVAYLSKRYLPKKWKPAGYIGAVGLGAYGLYSIYKAFVKEKEPGNPATPDLNFPLIITNPYAGEEWSTIFTHLVKYEIVNNYNTKYRVYAGMSLIHDETGEIWDAPIIPVDVEANDATEVKWRIGAYFGRGKYWIVVSVWDMVPEDDCELQGICHRLGETDSYFYFTILG